MIICAAIKIKFVDSSDNVQELVVCGHRHGDCFVTINNLDKRYTQWTEQGFINHRGEFLNRKEAFVHAKCCGQLSQSTLWYKEDTKDSELNSEDLY